MMDLERRIIALADAGKVGSLRQVLALAKALSSPGGSTVEGYWVHAPSTSSPTSVASRVAAALPTRFWRPDRGLPSLGFEGVDDGHCKTLSCLASIAAAGHQPSVIVSSGRRAAGASVALAAECATDAPPPKRVHVLDPWRPWRDFDGVVIPDHDFATAEARRSAANAHNGRLVTMAGALVDSGLVGESNAAEGARRRAMLEPLLGPSAGGGSDRLVGVLVGGGMGADGAAAVGRSVLRLVGGEARVVVAASRRTTLDEYHALVDAVSTTSRGALAYHPALSSIPNPYEPLLGFGVCDALVVTADSVSMAAEAASSGTPLLIARERRRRSGGSGGGGRAKIDRFLGNLERRGLAADLDEALATGRGLDGVSSWWGEADRQPLMETGRVAAVLAKRLWG